MWHSFKGRLDCANIRSWQAGSVPSSANATASLLGEGFDFPNLKIAAVHSPHKSLAATLQFVGRFARTGSPTIGQAKFIAVTQEIKGELRDLWTEGSEWHEIIPSLNDERIQNELDIRTTLS